MACALEASAFHPPGVLDSIELHKGKQVTRRATIKALLGNSAMAVPEYQGQCKKRFWDGRVAVMRTGVPQWPSVEASNDRRVKVLTFD